MKENKKKLFKILSIILIAALSYLAVKNITTDNIRVWVGGSGTYGPIIYILLFTILPIFLFPVPILAFGGGVLFGVVEGTIYTVIGASLNSAIM